MNQQYRGTAPKPHQSALASWQNGQRALYQVIDASDGDAVVDTFRNRALADRLCATSPVYRVREYLIGG